MGDFLGIYSSTFGGAGEASKPDLRIVVKQVSHTTLGMENIYPTIAYLKQKPQKINGWKMKFNVGMAYFLGRTDSCREGNNYFDSSSTIVISRI